MAVSHASVVKKEKDAYLSNERLEYLGDAVLGMVVAEYLFKKYPYKNEGFLTEIRSRIVSREALNKLAIKIGLKKVVIYSKNTDSPRAFKSIYGDALEALIGAVYIDRGFRASRKFILEKLLQPHYDLEELIATDRNFKSKILGQAQKENKKAHFEIIEERRSDGRYTEFVAAVYLDNVILCTGTGTTKKNAEQAAAERACEMLAI